MLQLTRPLIFFDIESTGLNVINDRIVEIAIVKLFPNGTKENYNFRVNPEMHIPEEVVELHHISDADVALCPTFKAIAPRLVEIMKGCDIAGYNSGHFDIPMLAEEFSRTDVDFDLHKMNHIDVQGIFHKMEQRTLSAAYKFYCGKELEGAHGALADTEATCDVLMAQLEKYETLEGNVKWLAEFSAPKKNADFAGRIVYDDKGREVFNFGQYKGQLVEKTLKENPGYYAWMMEKEFPADTKRVLTQIKLRMR
ncbi:MAG: 3'-5' exonuclease [Bacteroidia bacterium]|nr:3'-5' exonuclease [Bacteroidia bacterium]